MANSFRCEAGIVNGIIVYELRRVGVQRIDINEVIQIKAHMDRLLGQGGTHVGYEQFMCKLPDFVSGKLGPQFGRFTKTFMHRMRFYRMGREWRTLHVNQPIGDMTAYRNHSQLKYDIEIGLLLSGDTTYDGGVNHGI